jgi:gas vesicle protein
MQQFINFLTKIFTLKKNKKMDELIQLKAQAFDAIASRDVITQQITALQTQLSNLDSSISDFKDKIKNYALPVNQQ